MKIRSIFGGLAAIGMILVAACGDDDSTEEEVADLCSDMAAVALTVEQIAGAQADPASTTVEDVQSALAILESEVQAVQAEAIAVGDSVKSALQDALSSYQSAVEDIPSDDTLEEAGAAVVAARDDFRQAWDSVLAELNCSTATTTS